MTGSLLDVSGLSKTFHSGSRTVAALSDVSFSIAAGETLALVGPSGSGKSTLARVLLRLIPADGGQVRFDGTDILSLSGTDLRHKRASLQMVFQDPRTAFNPRATVGRVLADPLRIHGIASHEERPRVIATLLERVGLPATIAPRALHEVSGGQRQRIAIARAIATRPKLIVLDEAMSALDVSTRARILELLAELQLEQNIAYLFVTHDLAVVGAVADRVAVMDQGTIVETGSARDVLDRPQSVTGKALVAAMPRLLPRR